MQFVVRVDIEDAVVRILTDHAMQLLPLALLLKLLQYAFSRAFISSARAAGMSWGRCTSILTR